jgi:hypothetical protein
MKGRAALDAHRALAEAARAEHRLAQNLRVRGLLHAREGRAEEALEALDVRKLSCDFLVFSGYKVFGPMGGRAAVEGAAAR